MTNTSVSDYEDYQFTSRSYDNLRTSLGLEILLGSFARHPHKTLEHQRLLDAGCGTGSFLYDIAAKFKFATGLDASVGMLEQARSKLVEFKNVTLTHGSLPELPFEENSFDAIMINQVVHHLDEEPDFSNFKRLVEEAFRVIAPGGSMVIHTSSKEQVRHSYWFGWVIPQAKKRMASRYAPIPMVQNMLETTGFKNIRVTVPMEAMFDKEFYLNQEGPFTPEWRACDSMFALATDEELANGLKRLRDACDDGAIEQVINKAERWREHSGQSTFISVRKA